MKGSTVIFWIGFIIISIHQVRCDDNMALMFSKIEDIDEEIADVRRDMSRIEDKVISQMKFAKASFRSELKQYLKHQVREAMAEILKDESNEEMARSQVVSEVRKLKHGQHQMKRQLLHLMKSLRDVQGDRETYKEALLKAEKIASGLKTCCKYVGDTTMVERDLKQSQEQTKQKEKENQELMKSLDALNETCQFRKMKLHNSTESTIQSAYESTSTSPVATSSSTATTRPEEERSRIIVAPYHSSTQHQFRQVNIHNKSLSSYPYLSEKCVLSLTYVSKLRKLLIGLYGPYKIVSSNLDSYGVKTMKVGVQTYGMTVDEDREIVFIGTDLPRKSISRMTTQGKHFTTVSTLSGYDSPYGIAVNPKEEKIYVCDFYKVFVMTYDGRLFQTLAEGTRMFSIALDKTGDVLYYGDNKKLMKMSLSDNRSYDVTTLSIEPRNLICSSKSLYFGSDGFSGTMGVVDIGNDSTTNTLQTIRFARSYGSLIVLVP